MTMTNSLPVENDFESKRRESLRIAQEVCQNPQILDSLAEERQKSKPAPTVKTAEVFCHKHRIKLEVKEFQGKSFTMPCPDCHREEKVKEEKKQQEREKGRKAWELEQRRERAKNNLESLNFPQKIIKKGLDGFRQRTDDSRESLQVTKAFIRDFPRCKSIILVGEVGRGKSHLAICASYAIAAKGNIVIWGNPTTLFGRIQAKFGKGESALQEIERFQNCDLLFIDDLDKKPLGDWAKSIFFDIIDYRTNHEKPTIITTNRDAKKLKEFFGVASDGTDYGEPILSRLCDRESCQWLKVTGIDWRREDLA